MRSLARSLQNRSPVKPVTADGGYVAGPVQLPERGKVKLEVCLAAPGGRSRLRATLTLMQHWETKEWQVAFVDLSRETYVGSEARSRRTAFGCLLVRVSGSGARVPHNLHATSTNVEGMQIRQVDNVAPNV